MAQPPFPHGQPLQPGAQPPPSGSQPPPAGFGSQPSPAGFGSQPNPEGMSAPTVLHNTPSPYAPPSQGGSLNPTVGATPPSFRTVPAPQGANRIGRYELLKELARGGMGVVYVARDVELDRQVALKQMLAQGAASPEEVERFKREARAVARLQHANIVQVFDVGYHNGAPYMVMDLIKGQSLHDQVKNQGPLDGRKAAEITVQLSGALGYAHSNNILHRDLKPHNVLVNERGEPKITDFGLAKVADLRRMTAGADDSNLQQSLTVQGQILGTPAFMPPEQAEGDVVDARADIYSLGATLYALVTGRPPFSGKSLISILNAVFSKEPEPPTSHQPNLDPGLERIILRCLEKDPAQRYPTAEALGADLQRFLKGETDAAPAQAAPGGGGSKGLPIVLVVLLLAALAAGAFFAINRPQPLESKKDGKTVAGAPGADESKTEPAKTKTDKTVSIKIDGTDIKIDGTDIKIDGTDIKIDGTDIKIPTKTEDSPPTKTEDPPPTKTEDPPPAKTEDPPPAKTEDPPPTKTEDPPPAKTEDPPPAKTEDPPPAKTEDPPPAKTEDPPPAKTEDPPPAKTEDPPPAKTKDPPPRTNSVALTQTYYYHGSWEPEPNPPNSFAVRGRDIWLLRPTRGLGTAGRRRLKPGSSGYPAPVRHGNPRLIAISPTRALVKTQMDLRIVKLPKLDRLRALPRPRRGRRAKAPKAWRMSDTWLVGLHIHRAKNVLICLPVEGGDDEVYKRPFATQRLPRTPKLTMGRNVVGIGIPNGPTGLYTLPEDGGAPTQSPRSIPASEGVLHAISPNDAHLVFQLTNRIVVRRRADLKRVAEARGTINTHGRPAFSPDGRYLAWVDSDRFAHVMRIEDGVRTLVEFHGFKTQPGWVRTFFSPDGRLWILAASTIVVYEVDKP